MVSNTRLETDHVVLAVDHEHGPHDAVHPVHGVAVRVVLRHAREPRQRVVRVEELLNSPGLAAGRERFRGLLDQNLRVLVEEEALDRGEEVAVHHGEEVGQAGEGLALELQTKVPEDYAKCYNYGEGCYKESTFV